MSVTLGRYRACLTHLSGFKQHSMPYRRRKNSGHMELITSLLESENDCANVPRSDMRSRSDVMLRNAQPYLREVLMEKDKARRSVLILSSLSSSKVESICTNYGQVENVDWSRKTSLVEFKDVESVHNVMCDGERTYLARTFTPHRCRVAYTDGSSTQSANMNPCKGVSRANLAADLRKCTTVGDCVRKTAYAYQLSTLHMKYNYFLCQLLDDLLFATMSKSCVIPHGSVLSGLSTNGSDLDLVVHPYGISVYDHHEQPSLVRENSRLTLLHSSKIPTESEIVANLAFLIKRFCIGSSDIVSIHNARVPIVRFNSRVSRSRCDITCSLDKNDGVLASFMLRRVCEYNEDIRLLCQCVRVWAKSHLLTSDQPGHCLINFSLTHMVIFFLQHIQILPSIQHILESDESTLKHMTNQTNMDADLLGDLYIKFFKFWAGFDYSLVIDVYHGSTVPSNYLPSDNFNTKQYPLKIVHTLDDTFNISRRTNRHYLELFVSKCSYTYEKLKKSKPKGIGERFHELHIHR